MLYLISGVWPYFPNEVNRSRYNITPGKNWKKIIFDYNYVYMVNRPDKDSLAKIRLNIKVDRK